jgi:hypothetical protein
MRSPVPLTRQLQCRRVGLAHRAPGLGDPGLGLGDDPYEVGPYDGQQWAGGAVGQHDRGDIVRHADREIREEARQ